MSTVLERLTKEVSSMRRTIDEQHVVICNLTRNNEKQSKEIRALKVCLSKYEKPTKDSTNSSTPPSKEGIKSEAARRTKSLRKPSGLKPGGQPGHEGTTLKKTECLDETVDVFANYCTNCGHALEDCEREFDYVTQVIFLPGLRPVTKEIRHFITICRQCGTRVQSHNPRRRGTNMVVYDASVKSLAVYLSVVHFLSYGRIEGIFRDVFGFGVSQGSLVNWINEAKRNSEPAIEKIREYIMKSTVVGFDESGCYCSKRLDWAWIAQTVYFTLLFRGSGRSGKELESRFGSSLEHMVAVTDRHSAYFALHFLNHQVCLAHLLRELEYLNDLDGGQEWSRDIEKLLQDAIHERNGNAQAVIDKKGWLEKLDGYMKWDLTHLPIQFEKFRKGLIKCRDYIFNFLEDPLIPPDNNASERGIRKLKIKLKNSGTFRTDWGADAFLYLHSIVETTKKHGLSTLKAIQALFQGPDDWAMVIAE